MKSLPVWLTSEHSCNYLDKHVARLAVLEANVGLDPSLYSLLIDQGFRRSGDQVYRPHCQTCQSCVPTRLPVNQFRPDRAQKRCEKRNAQTQAVIKPAVFEPKHFDLYLRYQADRHSNSADHTVTPDEYMQFLGSSWSNTLFVEFNIGGKLSAVAVVDVVDQGLSAVYTFFDPVFSDYSPGVFAVLWQIKYARSSELPYLYLGFWVKDCRKMRYKTQYQPLYGLIDHQWQPISHHH